MHINISNLKHALIGQVDRNNVVANNLANINTTGFKKDFVFFDAFGEELKKRDGQNHSIDHTQGQLKQTENPLDFALSSRGFFTVETDKGVAYTREGHFKLDNDGLLRTASGHLVLGETGPIVLLGKNIKPETVTVTRNGEVYRENEFIDRLQITDFENKDQLKKIGDNLFSASDDAIPDENFEAEVHQGFLEESNVNPAQEMIQLIEVQRQFESLQKMVRSLDEVFQTAANQVGRY